MSAAFAASAAAAAAASTIDVVALQAWVAHTHERIDAADTAITGVSLNLEATVGQAKEAMGAIVRGFRGPPWPRRAKTLPKKSGPDLSDHGLTSYSGWTSFPRSD